MSDLKSYRTVTQVPAGAMRAAAAYVESEWGEGYTLGYAGTDDPINGTAIHVFQVLAGDGSRFLVWASKYGERGSYPTELERVVAARLDVEVN